MHGFCMVGQKIGWMRANPLVCVEADEVVNHTGWASVPRHHKRAGDRNPQLPFSTAFTSKTSAGTGVSHGQRP
jgi:hypothetical protein